MIEELFILNARGDLLISQRHSAAQYDLSYVYEAVFHRVIVSPTAEPTLRLRADNIAVAVVQKSNIFFCASYRGSDESAIEEMERFDWLQSLCSDVASLIGDIDEISILQNKGQLSELFDELLFRGWPVCESIASLPRNTLLSPSSSPPPAGPALGSLSSFNAKPVEPIDDYLIMEVVDTLQVHFDSLGRKVSHYGGGRITALMNPGSHHDVEMTLDWTRETLPPQSVTHFDTCTFHKDVDLLHFDKYRKVKCKVASNHTTLLHYALPNDRLTGPIQLHTSIRRHRTLDMSYDLFIIIKPNFSSQLQAEGIVLRILVPETTLDVTCDSTSPPEFRKGFMYRSNKFEVDLNGTTLHGGQDAHIRYKLRLSSPLDVISDVGPLFFSYSIVGMNLAGLRIASIVHGNDSAVRSISSDRSSLLYKKVHREVRYTSYVNEIHSYA